jgi:predicted aspartyl protease
MIKLRLTNGLPFAEVTFIHNGKVKLVPKVLIDTGSMSTIISTDIADELGLKGEPDDILHAICGVGGSEFVYEKCIDLVEIDGVAKVSNLTIQVGAMDYGFDINSILGMNYLMAAKIIIDTGNLTLYSHIKTIDNQ